MLVSATQDPYVRVGYRLSIYQRIERLRASKPLKKQIGTTLDGLVHEEITDAPTVIIATHLTLTHSLLVHDYKLRVLASM